jgi:hypothetical protein
MTKNVRVENGDSNTSYKIVVEKWNKGDPNSDPPVPDTMEKHEVLSNPADLNQYGLHSGNYLKVYETPAES